MASYVGTGASTVTLLPTTTRTTPATYSLTGGATIPAVLSDGSTASYVAQASSSDYFREQVSTAGLPTGARVVYVQGRTTARRDSYSPHDYVVAIGVRNPATGGMTVCGSSTHSTLTTLFTKVATPGVTTTPSGAIIGQSQISGGLFILFGKNTGATDTTSMQTAEASIVVAYDAPPTVTNVAPTGTINNTGAPLITWDYIDDAQQQAAYQVQISNGTSIVYDSGKVTSSSTFHQVGANLPNGSYTASIFVWQVWNGPGGAYQCLAPGTTSFTISILPLPAPQITATNLALNYNLLQGNDATFTTGLGNWTHSSSGTLTWSNTDGVSALGCAVLTSPTNTSSNVATVTVDLSTLALQGVPLDLSLALKITDPNSAATVTVRTSYYDTTNTYLTDGVKTVVAGTSLGNGWTRYTGLDVFNPPTTARYVYLSVTLKTSAAGSASVAIDDPILSVYNVTAVPSTKPTDSPGISVFLDPKINFLNYDDASFDNGLAGWQALTNCTIATVSSPVKDGQAAMQVTATATGTVTVGQYAAAVVWPYTYFPCTAFWVAQKVANSGRAVVAWVKYYDASFNYLGIVNSTSVGLAANTSYQGTPGVLNNYLYANTAYVSVGFNITGMAAGEVMYVDDFLLTDYTNPTTTPWTRGGVITNTFNQMTYDDSTMGPSHNWISNNTNTTAVTSTDYARQGQTSLKMTRTGSTGSIDVVLGNSVYFPATASSYVSFICSVYSPTVSRTATLQINCYDASFNGLTGFTHNLTTVVGAWATTECTSTPPANTAYVSVELLVTGAAANEVHYLDCAAFYNLTSGQYTNRASIGWQAGQYPSTDAVPTMHVQRLNLDDSTAGWVDVADIPVTGGILSYYDFEARSGVHYQYNGYLTKMENGLNQVGPTTDANGYAWPSSSITLNHAWMHARTNPVATFWQWQYDGAGRQKTDQVTSNTTVVDGRTFPFAEFTSQQSASLQVTLQCANLGDLDALRALAKSQSEIVFRDQRGRGVAGIIGPVQFTDEVWGSTASFTLMTTGNQPT